MNNLRSEFEKHGLGDCAVFAAASAVTSNYEPACRQAGYELRTMVRQEQRRTMRVLFCPPKPKLLDMQMSTRALRGALGM